MKNYKEEKTWGLHKIWKLALSVVVLLLFGLVTDDYENQVAFTLITLLVFWVVFFFVVQKRFRNYPSMSDMAVLIIVPIIYLLLK